MRNRHHQKAVFSSLIRVLVATSFITLILLPENLLFLPLGGFEFSLGVGDVILTLLLPLVIGEILLTGRIKFACGINRLDTAVLLYAVSLLFPVFVALVRYPEMYSSIIAGYVHYLECFLIYYLLRRTLYKEVQAARLLKIFVAVWIGVLVASIIQKISPGSYLALWETIGSRGQPLSETFVRDVRWRLSGPFFNPNTLARFLLLAVPMGWAIYSFKHRVLAKLSYVCVTMLSLAVFVLTLSRSGYLGFLFMLLCFMYYSTSGYAKFNKLRILIIVMLAGVGLLYGETINRRMEHTFRDSGDVGPSLEARFALWKASIHAVGRYWLVGFGHELSVPALREFVKSNESLGGTHNTFLRVLVEDGIVVFGVFLFLLAQIWSWRKAKLAEPWNTYKYAVVAGFVGLIITGLSGDTFQNASIMSSLMFLLGVLNGVCQLQKRRNYLEQPEENSLYNGPSPLGAGRNVYYRRDACCKRGWS